MTALFGRLEGNGTGGLTSPLRGGRNPRSGFREGVSGLDTDDWRVRAPAPKAALPLSALPRGEGYGCGAPPPLIQELTAVP
jgi:hypothetical protein